MSTLTTDEADALRFAQIPLTPGEKMMLLDFLGWPEALPDGNQARVTAVVERILYKRQLDVKITDVATKLDALIDRMAPLVADDNDDLVLPDVDYDDGTRKVLGRRYEPGTGYGYALVKDSPLTGMWSVDLINEDDMPLMRFVSGVSEATARDLFATQAIDITAADFEAGA